MVEVGGGSLASVSAVISGGPTAATSVGMGLDGCDRPSECSKCSKWREAVVRALEELDRGRLDLAREQLRKIATLQHEG